MAAKSDEKPNVADEKALAGHQEDLKAVEDPTQFAGRGQAATDQYGRALFEFDKKAESRLRWKMDFCLLPTVSLLYLFCFIDRANIGMFFNTSSSNTVVSRLTKPYRKRETRRLRHRSGPRWQRL